MNRLPLLLVFLIASLAHSAVYACSCGTGAPPVEFNRAKAIFIGKVLGGTESWEEKTQDGIPHQFDAGNVRVVPAPVYFFDVGVKEPNEPMDSIIKFHKPSIEAWLKDWLDGKDLWHEVWR
jgi:hypothetical protein